MPRVPERTAQNFRPSRLGLRLREVVLLAAILLASAPAARAATQYFSYDAARTTWDGSYWSAVSGGPYTDAWTPDNDAVFETTAGAVSVGAAKPTGEPPDWLPGVTSAPAMMRPRSSILVP